METENKIIKLLIENKRSLTIREVSKEIKSDYKIVHTAVLRLVNKGILNQRRIGKAIQVSLSNNFTKEIFQAEFERRTEILKNKNLSVMFETIKKEVDSVNFILLLFGSYSKKTENKKSDIDLIFILPNLENEKRIEQIISILPLKIHSLIFTERQFKEMKDSRELNVVKEAIKNNIILYGIEQYYELIK